MAYNQYNQGGAGQQPGYGGYNPYGQSGNPYSQTQGNPYTQTEPSYGNTGNYSERPDLEHHSSSRYDEENLAPAPAPGSYEMTNLNGRDPNRILNEVRNVDTTIDRLENELERLAVLRRTFLDNPDTSTESTLGRQMTQMTEDIMVSYRGLTTRVKALKQDPESGNPRNKAQVGKADRRLKTAINQYQQADRSYREEVRAQISRQYRIVRPDASDAEVREAVEDTSNQQVFSTALISQDRRGEVRSIQRNVNTRHAEIQQIERDMMELAQLFNDLEAAVVQQEPAVTQIEEKGQEAAGHVAKANTELDGAVKKARSARRKKLICLGIAILIVIIIVVVVVVVVEVTKH